MRHKKGYRRLNRTSSHRNAMFRNMVTSVLEHGKITTTDVKAKELRRIVERVITLSKRVTPDAIAAAPEAERSSLEAARVHAVRLARRWVQSREVLHKLFSEYGPRFKSRPGGYTRIVKLGFRAGDNSSMSLIEILPGEDSVGSSVEAPAAAAPEVAESSPAV